MATDKPPKLAYICPSPEGLFGLGDDGRLFERVPDSHHRNEGRGGIAHVWREIATPYRDRERIIQEQIEATKRATEEALRRSVA